jgi:hypothetical protein
MPIKRIPRQILNAAELAALGSRLTTLLQPAVKTDTHLAQLVVLLAGHTAAIEAGLDRGTANRITPQLKLSDTGRDRICIKLGRYLYGMQFSAEPKKARAGAVLYAVVKRNGFGKPRHSYATQSTAIKAILANLAGARMQAAIVEAGASVALAQLAVAQEEFERLVQRKITAQAERPAPLTPVLALLRRDLRDICAHCTSCERINPGAWGEINRRVNKLVTEMAASARQRQGARRTRTSSPL